MKIQLSWLREFVDVPGSPDSVAQTMSVRGFAVEGIEAIDGGDAVLDFEVTANRPDCLSVIGMAREVATAYDLPLRLAGPLAMSAGPPLAGPALRTGADSSAGSRAGSAEGGPAESVGGAGAAASRPAESVRGPAAAEGGPAESVRGAGAAAGGPAESVRGAASAASGPAESVRGAGAAAGGPGESVRGAGAAAGGPAAIDIAIENPDLCPRYVGAVADVQVRPSPLWMQARLQAAGVRPINNIVDVTNYVLLEFGQPMHAFDFGALAGARIRVRNAKPGEQLRTLDGQPRALSPDVLVIADAERAAAIAGVMGGADSEVTNATTTIVLESASFDPRSVRRTSKKLGLRSEASTRFERGADPGLPALAMARALALLETIDAGRGTGTVVDCYPNRRDPLQLRLRRARIAGLLGAALPDADVRRILTGLGFTLHDAADGWDVAVPTRRVDVVREVDLIEELARHYGFDRLPVTFPVLSTAPRPIDPRIAQTRHLRAILTAQGFSEAVTFGFMAHTAAAPFAPQDDIVSIANPLSENFAVLRPSALPGLIDAVAHNRNREQRDVRLFEIGARFSRTAGERRAVACAWTGSAAQEHWAGGARDVDLFDMKGVVERVCEAAGVPIDSTASCREPWLAPGRSAEVHVDGTRVGLLGQLAANVADAHGLPADPVYVAEIDLDALERLGRSRELRVEPLPRYPSVTRDISVLVDDTLAAADVRDTIRRAGPDTLTRVAEFDRYQGKGVPDHKVSLSLRLTFRSADRTLTDSEVQTAMERVLSALAAQHGAVQR